MSLSIKQARFALALGEFLHWIGTLPGVRVTMGETWRHPDVGHGHQKSLHKKRLAADLNLFVDGVYITGEHPYWELLGRKWESLDDDAAWGGRFEARDWNHFSFTDEGMR